MGSPRRRRLLDHARRPPPFLCLNLPPRLHRRSRSTTIHFSSLFSGDRYLFFLVSGFDDDRKVVLFTFCARAFTNRVSPLESKNSLSNLSLFISLSLSLGAEVSLRFR